MSKRKSFQDFVEKIKLAESIKIGDLVSLNPEYKRYHYPIGQAPLYQWSIGLSGHVTNGTLDYRSTAIVLEVRIYKIEERVKLRTYKLLVDTGIEGWFCDGGTHLEKQN